MHQIFSTQEIFAILANSKKVIFQESPFIAADRAQYFILYPAPGRNYYMIMGCPGSMGNDIITLANQISAKGWQVEINRYPKDS